VQFFTNLLSEDSESKFMSREQRSEPFKGTTRISPVPLQLAGKHSQQPPPGAARN